MTSKIKTDIKAFFQTGDRPTEAQFVDLIDSYVDKSGPIGTLETACSAGAQGAVVTDSGGTPSIAAYSALRVSQGITVYTTALVDDVITATFATTAAATAGVSADGLMSPVLTKAAILAHAFTSANYASTAQANAGTNSSTVMNPVLTKNAIAALSSGTLVSVQYATNVTAQSVTGTIPMDDTIPQNTEGDEILTLSFTPTNASNRLKITVTGWGDGSNSGTDLTVAIFQGAGASAVHSAAYWGEAGSATEGFVISQTAWVTAGTTSSLTIAVRAGRTSGTFYLNGISSGRLYGGSSAAVLTVEEYIP